MPETAAPYLSVQMHHRLGTLDLDVDFKLTQPWTILFGPSGSGKSTLLRALAGLLRPEHACIVCTLPPLAGEVQRVTFSGTNPSVFVPPHRRPVRFATQSPLLFPHLTVRENLLFGAEWHSKPIDEVEIAEHIMALFRITALCNKLPRELSGGEQQRASVARALVAATTYSGLVRPLLLLDEPFSGLEATLRDDLLRDLQSWVTRWKIPVLSVTHDVAEAFQLGAEVIKLAEGRVVAQGRVEVVLAEERQRLLRQLRGEAE